MQTLLQPGQHQAVGPGHDDLFQKFQEDYQNCNDGKGNGRGLQGAGQKGRQKSPGACRDSVCRSLLSPHERSA